MSLKVFHVIFVIAVLLLSIGCAYWAFAMASLPVFGWCSVAAGVGALVYGYWFIGKARHIIT